MIQIRHSSKRPPIQSPSRPKFGTVFSPHMLKMKVTESVIAQRQLHAEIVPWEEEPLSPATSVFHYGQSIFEGLKAFRQPDSRVAAFRADLHARRFMFSSEKMAIPVIGEEIFMQCLMDFVRFEQESVPCEDDHALYLRPFIMATDPVIKVGRSMSYEFFIIASFAGPYFTPSKSGHGARVLVNRQFVRAYPGGLGEAKASANYAASLGPQSYAAQKFQCDQVLYLNAVDHDHIDELGGMNFFMVRGQELVTPALTGTILNGVTRRSILELAEQMGLKGREEAISLTQMVADIKNGKVSEVFACGTAAVVSPLGSLVIQDKVNGPSTEIILPEQMPIAKKVSQTIKAVQRGQIKAPGDWLFF